MTEQWTGEEEAAAAKAKTEKLADTKTWRPQKEHDGEDLILVGVLIEAKKVSGNYGPTIVLNIEDNDGQVWTVWAGDKVIKDALELEAQPAIGHGIRLVYSGKQPPKKAGGYAYHMWTVVAQERDAELWNDMTMEGPRNEPLTTAADGMEDPF